MVKPKYIDLFAGCGGLSLGLESAGFDLALAVEKSDMAAETFYHNFIEPISDIDKWKQFVGESTTVLEQASKKLVVKELAKVLECPELLSQLKKADIDLIAGGPPCQGFSMAGRRNPKDARNLLPWQFIELVEATHPKAVVIENVSGMRQDFVKHGEKSPFEQLRIVLSDTGPGYMVQPVLLNAMHFGVPQHRPRVMLIGIRKDVGKKLGIYVTEEVWKSEYDQLDVKAYRKRPDLAPQATHFGDGILTVQDAIWDLANEGYSATAANKKYSTPAGEYAARMRGGNKTKTLPNQTLRKHAPHIEHRFRLYQYLRDNNIPSRILNIPAKSNDPEQIKLLQVRELLMGAKLPATAPDGIKLADNLDGLCRLILDLNTKKHSQRPLNWSAPSPTVVSLPDDFVHPEVPRTLTVREMARFQSFPDNFEFRSKETTGSLRRRFEVPQYTQVGNAVPPLLAAAVGKMLFGLLGRYNKADQGNKELLEAI